MTESLRDRIIRHEGMRLKPYLDSRGIETIGIGRNLKDKGISEAEAYILLDNDLQECREEIIKNLPWAESLPTIVYGVLTEMVFQLGIYGVLQFRHTLQALQSGKYSEAADAILSSAWAKQTPERVKELSDILRNINKEAI